MRRCWIALALLLGLWAGPVLAEMASFDAMLIKASNESAPLDARLERVEYQLRPLLRFESYRLLNQASGSVNVPGETSLALGDGYLLLVRASKKDGGIRYEVRWLRGDQALLNTTVTLKRGKTAVLGGVPEGEGKLIVVLTAQ